jgi:branched-chain amino acid transport system ATP-binding protein
VVRAMLEIVGLSKSFGGIAAVHDMNFTVQRGEIVSLIGPNGAGKTTCLNLISGFYRPDSGKVLLDGLEVTGERPFRMAQRRVVRTFQKTNVLKNLTVRDNVLAAHYLSGREPLWRTFFVARARARIERDIGESADEILKLVGLEARRGVEAGALSCGELRLLELALALGAKPRLLMLDEPAAGLNTHEAEALAALLRRVRTERVEAMLLIEHNMALVMSVSDRVVVMNTGEKLAEGTPEAVRNNRAVRFAYLGKVD